MEILVVSLLVLFAIWGYAHFRLAGGDMGPYDVPRGSTVIEADQVSAEHAETVAFIPGSGITGMDRSGPAKQRLERLRQTWEQVMPRYELPADIRPTDAAGVTAEWVLAPGADPGRRLLYIHGGAFVLCSPRTHRGITTQLSTLTGAAVLAIDYRLQPEHRRRDTIDDCRAAYRWMLDNGPGGAGAAAAAYVAGDSAGGNLTLGLLAWIRDAGLRAPDAAAALSPSTDSTFGSPSLKSNVATDPVLGPAFARIARVPRTILLYTTWLSLRFKPCNPLVSPIHGDLAGLPPLLVQASEAEILIDECRRYVNKAASQGSPASLQVWPSMVHVWPFFDQPESADALARIADFFAQHTAGDAEPPLSETARSG
jgi:acetyl esterase/lipase